MHGCHYFHHENPLSRCSKRAKRGLALAMSTKTRLSSELSTAGARHPLQLRSPPCHGDRHKVQPQIECLHEQGDQLGGQEGARRRSDFTLLTSEVWREELALMPPSARAAIFFCATPLCTRRGKSCPLRAGVATFEVRALQSATCLAAIGHCFGSAQLAAHS